MSNEPLNVPTEFPLVTVAMPVYNAGVYLRLAVISIIKQTYTNWELILIDDGSTDRALESIADIKDDRIQLYRDGKNKGLGARLNECIDLAKGEYFARMDQDDVSFPKRFERQVQVLLNNPSLDLLAVRAITIDSNDEFTGWLPYDTSQREISARPWRSFYLPHPCWMGKTTWFRKFRYASPAPYFCEDQELLLRSHAKSVFDVIPEALFAYRIRDKIDYHKLFKTRIAVLRIQWSYFLSGKEISYMILSVFAFIVRVIFDVSHEILNAVYLKRESEHDEATRKWEQVLQTIYSNH